ncbi:hypothetical protein EG327_004829, partial [Venturia inaequalis]
AIAVVNTKRIANGIHPSLVALKAPKNEVENWDDPSDNNNNNNGEEEQEEEKEKEELEKIEMDFLDEEDEQEELYRQNSIKQYITFWSMIFDKTRISWQGIRYDLKLKLERLFKITRIEDIYTCLSNIDLEELATEFENEKGELEPTQYPVDQYLSISPQLFFTNREFAFFRNRIVASTMTNLPGPTSW